jgi:FAD:protein FMN transferase
MQPRFSMQGWFEKLSPAPATGCEPGSASADQLAGFSVPPTLPQPGQDQAPDPPSPRQPQHLQPTLPGTQNWRESVWRWLGADLSIHNCPMQSISRAAMACEFEVLLNERQYSQGVEVAVEALDQVGQMEERLSIYRPQSQFSKLNAFASLRPVAVDYHTLEVIQLALDAWQWTAGCYDITAGQLSEIWGFARRQAAMPTTDEIAQALACVGSQHILLDYAAQTVALKLPGLKLNPGGIGKGYALDIAAKHLAQAGIEDYMMHGGLSSIIARGKRRGANSQWTVALKHPWRTEETLETFPLNDAALGTSGAGKQFFHFGGKRYSHLIDPRTGWPADGMMSATVVCPSGAIADALATGLFVMGIQAAIDFCDAHPQIAAIFIYQDPKSGSQQIEHRNWLQVVS